LGEQQQLIKTSAATIEEMKESEWELKEEYNKEKLAMECKLEHHGVDITKPSRECSICEKEVPSLVCAVCDYFYKCETCAGPIIDFAIQVAPIMTDAVTEMRFADPQPLPLLLPP
jgi:hypothetical protein